MQVVMRHDRDFFAGSVVILFVIAGLARQSVVFQQRCCGDGRIADGPRA
jgi:hypothetical protein